MSRSLKIELRHNGELVNKWGDGGKYYGWDNAIDVIPPVGSILEYLSFNQGYKENQGVLTKYKVVSPPTFTMEEDYNNGYRNKRCIVDVEPIS